MRKWMVLVISFLPLAAMAPVKADTRKPPIVAEPNDPQAEAHQYHHCLTQAKRDPDDGLEEALAWISMGGGEPARHCLALARIGQRQYDDGANRLEALARTSLQENALKAEMLSQAAQAWVLAGNWDRADADQRTALGLMPDQLDILVDHALTLGQVHHYKEAADELSRVLARYPGRIDAWVLRASARRYLDDRQAALDDVERALTLDPTNPDGLLERGMLRRLGGDNAGARSDWLKLLNHDKVGAAADAARRNLELLEVKQD
jgi:tetratricopeptide (TPR) repeat protein